MKKNIFTIVMILLVTVAINTSIYASTDFSLVKNVCNNYNKPIKMISGYSEKNTNIIGNRKNKNYIIVEKVISFSSGNNFGYDKYNYFIKYNKKVKKNKKVISYLIYNPNTNYLDDIIYIVDNGMIR
jgi:hypothetical protein